MSDNRAMHRGNYGYDAPLALMMFGGFTAISAVLAVIFWSNGQRRPAAQMTIYFVFFLANATTFFHTTRRGKFQEWDRILEELRLTGNEHVLDLGCGRGAVLTAVARRLTTGRTVGVDVWSTQDQSGNASAVTVGNASIEGVADRVAVVTADMRALPFASAAFDLAVSSLAIHNIRSNAARRQAIAEGFRVLKPGGRIVIADIRATRTYEQALRRLGATNIHRRRLGWRFWWGNPIAATRLLTAEKASA